MSREHLPVFLFKRSLIGLWAVWMSVVFATNVLDAARALDILGPDWGFASGNFSFLTQTTARYGTPAWVNGVLFAGVIAWEGLAAGLFWLACIVFRGPRGTTVRYAAFGVALALWLAFAVADEVFITYQVEATHLRLFVAQLVTLLAVELLPERRSGA